MAKWYQGTEKMPLNYLVCWKHLISYTNTTSRVENTITEYIVFHPQHPKEGGGEGELKESFGGALMPRPSNPDPVFKRQNQFITCIWPCLKEETFFCGLNNNYGDHKRTSTLLFFKFGESMSFFSYKHRSNLMCWPVVNHQGTHPIQDE